MSDQGIIDTIASGSVKFTGGARSVASGSPTIALSQHRASPPLYVSGTPSWSCRNLLNRTTSVQAPCSTLKTPA